MRPVALNINTAILVMLCGFAFMIPFELILEILFNIETQLKPFRIFAIFAILLFGVKVLHAGFRKVNFIEDLPFYLIFFYGLLISLVRMPAPFFSSSLFNSDFLQITLYLLIFFVIKNCALTKKGAVRIYWFLTAGILLNCLYLFNSFFFLHLGGRQGGFMDNPNYVSLSIVIAIAFISYRLFEQTHLIKQLIYLGFIFFLLFVFPITGSRTGLVLLIAIGLLIFFFSSLRSKLIITLAFSVLSFFFIGKNLEKSNFGASYVLTNRLVKKAGEEDIRIPIWKGALKAGEEVWFTGMGIGQFKAKFSRIFQNEYNEAIVRITDRGAFLSTHSDYVGLLVVYGIVGLMLYLFYLFQISKKLLFRIRFSDNLQEQRFFQFNLMILVVLAIFGLTAENFLSPLYWLPLAMSTGSLQFEDKFNYSVEGKTPEVNSGHAVKTV